MSRDSTIRPLNILHIDDEPDFGDLVKTFLKRADESFTVSTETAASEALDRLKQTMPNPTSRNFH